jgi:hypothetical protein
MPTGKVYMSTGNDYNMPHMPKTLQNPDAVLRKVSITFL